jgi:hypothetical protein
MPVCPTKGCATLAAAGATPPKKSALFTDDTSVAALRDLGDIIFAIILFLFRMVVPRQSQR